MEIQEEIHHFAGWEGGWLRGAKIVNKNLVNKLAFPKFSQKTTEYETASTRRKQQIGVRPLRFVPLSAALHNFRLQILKVQNRQNTQFHCIPPCPCIPPCIPFLARLPLIKALDKIPSGWANSGPKQSCNQVHDDTNSNLEGLSSEVGHTDPLTRLKSAICSHEAVLSLTASAAIRHALRRLG